MRSRGLCAKVFQNPVEAFPIGPPAGGEDGDLDEGPGALSVFGGEGDFGMREPFGLGRGPPCARRQGRSSG
jgi:hypothetical protein